MFGDVVPYMEMDHLRWCFNKIITPNSNSKDLSCPNCLSAISEGYTDKISTWGGDVDLSGIVQICLTKSNIACMSATRDTIVFYCCLLTASRSTIWGFHPVTPYLLRTLPAPGSLRLVATVDNFPNWFLASLHPSTPTPHLPSLTPLTLTS